MSAQEDQTVSRQCRTVGLNNVGSLCPQEVTQPTIDGQCTLCKVTASHVGDCAACVNSTENVGLHFPREVEDYNRDTVVHPEKTQENVIPCRNLTCAATTRTVAREAETEFSLVWNQARAASIKHAFQQDQDSNVNGERMNVVNQEISCTESHVSYSNFATNNQSFATEDGANARSCVRSSCTSSSSMNTLNPVSEDRLQLNCGVGEHILRTTQCAHGVVVDI